MPLSIGVWRVDGEVRRLTSQAMPSEERLEELIEADPGILGQPLLMIGRQVTTAHGKRVDLLALDGDGCLHVLELKRDRTPRDVIAQALDYGSWVQGISHEEVLGIYAGYRPGESLEVAFEEAFGIPVPEELNTGHWLTVIASDLDAESHRIVEYLASYHLPVNVVFFRYFVDEGREYLARTWLIEQEQEAGPKAAGARTKEPWNGRDWYLRSLQQLPEGARVWACIPKAGYAGVGITTGAARPLRDSGLDPATLSGTYVHVNGEEEWVVPVEWLKVLPRSEAVWEKGMFANQNSACRLRNKFTSSGCSRRSASPLKAE